MQHHSIIIIYSIQQAQLFIRLCYLLLIKKYILAQDKNLNKSNNKSIAGFSLITFVLSEVLHTFCLTFENLY